MSKPLEVQLHDLLRAQKLTVATAESCTGGLVSDRITDVSGSSEYFPGGIIAYSYEAKANFLGVSWDVLNSVGAVSEETVLQMARGARKVFSADIAVSVSGIAGPTGGTDEKPVGTTWFGLATPRGEWARHFLWNGDREKNKHLSSDATLQFVLDYLEGQVEVNIVVIISANAEWRVIKEIFPKLVPERSPFGEYAYLKVGTWDLTLFHGGWGKISAAASAQFVIDRLNPDLIVNLGTCGGFVGRIETGAIILVDRTLVYDIFEQMGGWGGAIQHYTSSLDLSWLPEKLPHPVSRGLLVSADRDIIVEDIPLLIEKYDAVAADWESSSIAWVAQKNNKRLLILRAVSDLVGGDGGEAYGNIELFHERTKTVMKKLFDQLPDWLNIIEK